MSPKNVAIGALVAFVLAVAGLTFGGRNFLQSLEQADATISFLDLARQATDKREYEKADGYYKQALSYAERTKKSRENMALALGFYSDFLRMKRNPLKDMDRAKELEMRALAISHSTQ